MMFQVIFITIMLFAWPAAILASNATDDIRDEYVVKNVNGIVLTRQPTGAQWERVSRSDKLQEGQVIQVAKGASIVLETSASNRLNQVAGDRLQISINQPLVARLSKDIFRRVNLSSLFVERANKPLPPDLFDDEGFSWTDAWQRLAAFVTNVPKPEPKLDELSELERKGITVGVSAKPIKIISPVANTFVQSEDWPAELKVVWQRVKNKKPTDYNIYLWRHGTRRHRAVTETRGDYHTIKIPAPGTYFVQVTSRDQIWQSAPRSVYAVGPLTPDMISRDSQSNAPTDVNIRLLHPPTDAIFAANDRHGIDFGWSTQHPSSSKFVLSIYDANNETLKKLSAASMATGVFLAPGKYSWQVSREDGKLISRKQRFQVLPPTKWATERDRRAFLRQAISNKENASIIFEDGL